MSDFIQTFLLERTGLRGRIVKLGPVLDAILRPHGYPEPASRLTAEAAMLATLLASMLKFDGVFTFQAQGDGPVSMVVADLTSRGELRACATVREGRTPEAGNPLGKGYLAFTVDQGPQTERYQGIVELKSGGLTESVQHYFMQSEQVQTGLAVAVDFIGGQWSAGGILLQHMPEEGGRRALSSAEEDGWRRSMVLLQTCTKRELLDAGLSAPDLLYRLFHEEDVRAFDPHPVVKGCRCSDKRLRSILLAMPEDDRRDMTVGGRIVMNCQFCSRDFIFDPESL